MSTIAKADSSRAVAELPETEPVRLAIVGANFGGLIARELAAGGLPVSLRAICDSDAEKAARLADQLGLRVHASLDSALEDPDVEAVGLFTGPAGRAGLIERILKSGRSVMTTKPFELDPAAAARALDLGAELGLAVHMNSPSTVPSSDLLAIEGWVRELDLGRPVGFRACTWANYFEKADGSWLDDPKLCPAGPMYRLGVYLLNDFAHLVGTPKAVRVEHSRLRTGRPTADNAQLTLTYDSGALGHVFASFCVHDGRPWADDVQIAYERGVINRWVERIPAQNMAGDSAIVELRRQGQAVVRHTTKPGGFAGWYDWHAFHAAVRKLPGSTLMNREGTLAGVRLLRAMSLSALSGESVPI